MAKISAAAIVAVSFVLCSAAVAFDLQGHRGARGLAPENTLPAFTMALSIGVTTLELDLAMTSDGVLVVSHDFDSETVLLRIGLLEQQLDVADL